MKLFNVAENEEILFQGFENKIVITDQRIRQFKRTGKKPSFTTIMLDDIDSIEIKYASYPRAIILAILLGFGAVGTWETYPTASYICAIGIIISLSFYFSTRKYSCVFKSASSKISFPKKVSEGMELIDTINKIEHLKMT